MRLTVVNAAMSERNCYSTAQAMEDKYTLTKRYGDGSGAYQRWASVNIVPPADNADLKHTRRVNKTGPEVTSESLAGMPASRSQEGPRGVR
jgi:hypothetical protein